MPDQFQMMNDEWLGRHEFDSAFIAGHSFANGIRALVISTENPP